MRYKNQYRIFRLRLWFDDFVNGIIGAKLDGAGESRRPAWIERWIVFKTEGSDMTIDNASRRPHDDKIFRISDGSVLQP